MALIWFESHLSRRSQMVIRGDSWTDFTGMEFGGSQGSDLGSILYLLYAEDITALFAKHMTNGQLYSDNVQNFLGPPTMQSSLVRCMVSLSSDQCPGITGNQFSLNVVKTQQICLRTYQQILNLCVLTSLIHQMSVTWVWLLSFFFSKFLLNFTRSSFYNLTGLIAIQRSVPSSVTIVVRAFTSAVLTIAIHCRPVGRISTMGAHTVTGGASSMILPRL